MPEAARGAEVVVVTIPFKNVPDEGLTESRWTERQLGHPVIKAFNGTYAQDILDRHRPAGAPDRIALPVAGDDAAGKKAVRALITNSSATTAEAAFTSPDQLSSTAHQHAQEPTGQPPTELNSVKSAHHVQSRELVSGHAHHDEVVVPTGEEHVIAKATLLDETEPPMKCQRCLVVGENPRPAPASLRAASQGSQDRGTPTLSIEHQRRKRNQACSTFWAM